MQNKKKELEKYLKTMLFEYEIEDNVLELDNELFYIVTTDDNVFEIIIPEELKNEGVESYVYQFGGRWYTQKFGEQFSLSELKYKGEVKQKLATKSFLGIHSGYELLRGVGLYKDWVKKAKFLGIESLAICERNSLSGAIIFQTECKNAGIKPIFGMEIPVKNKGGVYFLKVYCKSFQGWQNLLKLNTVLNVDGKMHIEESFIEENREDLFIVADPKSLEFKDVPNFIDYYQLDTVQFDNEEKDKWYLGNLQDFIMSQTMSPISICDAYYLEQKDCVAREALWDISKAYDDKSQNQYFKNRDQYAQELIQLFENDNKSWVALFKEATFNEACLVSQCNFEYDTNTRHLPKYKMTEEESKDFSSSEELFLHLVKKGFREKNIPKEKVGQYMTRLKTEIEVLRAGDVIDYFLALHDIIRYAKKEDILTGIGRGSAGGSMVAYLLNIIQVDPLSFDLLFERFLNSGRMGNWEDRPAFIIEQEDGSEIELQEGALVKVIRGDVERAVFVHDLEVGDEIIRY